MCGILVKMGVDFKSVQILSRVGYIYQSKIHVRGNLFKIGSVDWKLHVGTGIFTLIHFVKNTYLCSGKHKIDIFTKNST